jgi:hypothetical protein
MSGKRSKNDAANAAAICEAEREGMREQELTLPKARRREKQ